MEPVYKAVIGFAVGVFRSFRWGVDVQGAEHLPASGPAVFAINHISYVDYIVAGWAARASGRLVRFLAKKEIFDRGGVGWLMRQMHHIPVDRFGRAADSFEAAVEALRRGQIIGMFPEATISRSFVPMSAKSGAARMALEANVPLIPGAVWGTQRILTKGRPRNLQRGVPITILIGEPVPYRSDEDPVEITKRLMDRITELLEKAQASYPDQPAGEDDRWWLPAHLGGTAPSVAEAEAERIAELQERRRQRRANPA